MSESWKPDFPNWKDRFPDLVWWMDLNEGRKVSRGSIDVDMRPLLDNSSGEIWLMRVDHRGIPMGPVNQDPDGEEFKGRYREKQTELKYEVWQYSLIVWCLQKMLFEQWKIQECYDVIRHFWRNLPGQPPLSSKSVGVWWAMHIKEKKKGILWP